MAYTKKTPLAVRLLIAAIVLVFAFILFSLLIRHSGGETTAIENAAAADTVFVAADTAVVPKPSGGIRRQKKPKVSEVKSKIPPKRDFLGDVVPSGVPTGTESEREVE